MAEEVDPGRLVEADDVDDERVPLPPAHRVPQERGVQGVALGMGAPVHVDLAPDVGGALEDHDDALLLGELDDLHRVRRRHHAGAPRGQAVALGVVLGQVLRVVVVERGRPRHERDVGLGRGPSAGAARARGRLRRGQRLAVRPDGPRRHVGDVGHRPDALLARHPAEVGGAVGEAGGRLGLGCGLRLARRRNAGAQREAGGDAGRGQRRGRGTSPRSRRWQTPGRGVIGRPMERVLRSRRSQARGHGVCPWLDAANRR